MVQRAKMILLAAQGWDNKDIALRLDARREVVSMWRKRFFEKRLAGLEERPRPGRPRPRLRGAVAAPTACYRTFDAVH
jgi:transposase